MPTTRATLQRAMEAVKCGDLDALRTLPALDLRLTLPSTRKGDSLLTWACRHSHSHVVRWLLEQGAAADTPRTSRGATALYIASQENSVECVKLLLGAGASVELAADDGDSPLYVACQRGHVAAARLLLGGGASPDQAQEDGATPLMTASCTGRIDCVRLLCGCGATVDQPTKLGTAPLLMASLEGRTKCVKVLLEAGADVNLGMKVSSSFQPHDVLVITSPRCPHTQGVTPLLMAAHGGHAECACLLSSWGASREPCHYGTPEDAAEGRGHAWLLAWFKLTRGWTPLHHLEQLAPARARALLRGGADILARAEDAHQRTRTPLERARSTDRLVAPEATCDVEAASEVSALLLRAAEPWSESSHELFPAAARTQAVEVMRLGYLLAAARYATEATALVDVWRQYVLPHAITRS
jgi:ankyrin repeat protein